MRHHRHRCPHIVLRRNASKRRDSTINRRNRSVLRAGLRHRVPRNLAVLKLREANRGINLLRSELIRLALKSRGRSLVMCRSIILHRNEMCHPVTHGHATVPVMDRGTEILIRDAMMGIGLHVQTLIVRATIVRRCSSPRVRVMGIIRGPVTDRRMSGRTGTGGTMRVGERHSLERMGGGDRGLGMRRTRIARSRRRSLLWRVSPFLRRQGMIRQMSRTSRMAPIALSAWS